MKKTDILLLLTLILSLSFIGIPLHKSIVTEIILCILNVLILYFSTVTLKYDNASESHKHQKKNRYIVPTLCLVGFVVSSIVFQILFYQSTVSYNLCVFMSLMHLNVSIVLAIFTIKVHKKLSAKNKAIAPPADIIFLINAVVSIALSFSLIFGFYICKSIFVMIA